MIKNCLIMDRLENNLRRARAAGQKGGTGKWRGGGGYSSTRERGTMGGGAVV
jgi:hypothetical protein